MEEEELARRRRRHWLSVLHLASSRGGGGGQGAQRRARVLVLPPLESRAALDVRPQASGRREERRHDGARSLVQNKEIVTNGEERRRL